MPRRWSSCARRWSWHPTRTRRIGVSAWPIRRFGRKAEAIDALKKAVNVNPYFWVNHNSLGEAYLQFGDHDLALEEFKRVIELEPNNLVGYNNIASAYFTQGKWEAVHSRLRAVDQAAAALADVFEPWHGVLLSEAL